MDALKLATMSLNPKTPAQKERGKATEIAGQFETIFVKTMVSSLRSTASIGGDGGGMFGDGPGSDTFTDWLDQNLAEQLIQDGGFGIATSLISDMERHGEISSAPEQQRQLRQAIAGPTFSSLKSHAGASHDVR